MTTIQATDRPEAIRAVRPRFGNGGIRMVNGHRIYTCGECGGEPWQHNIYYRYVRVTDRIGRVIRVVEQHNFVFNTEE